MVKELQLTQLIHIVTVAAFIIIFLTVLQNYKSTKILIFNSLFGQIMLNSDFYILMFNLKNSESIKPGVVLS
jgi:hypothetical protein